jgi:hypothetical protein
MLLAAMTLVDNPPQRPGCLRVVKCPGALDGCDCGIDGCKGNHWVGSRLVLVHHKTQRSRDPITVNFPAGTLSAALLEHHMSWGWRLLVVTDTNALFVSHRGDAFRTDSSFGAYLPRVLQELLGSHLSFTMLRRIAITGCSEWASRDQIEAMAHGIGTSVRKCLTVYDQRMKERAAEHFQEVYRSAQVPPPAAPPSPESETPDPDEPETTNSALAAREDDMGGEPISLPWGGVSTKPRVIPPPPPPPPKRQRILAASRPASFAEHLASVEAARKGADAGRPPRLPTALVPRPPQASVTSPLEVSHAPVHRAGGRPRSAVINKLSEGERDTAVSGSGAVMRAAYAYAYGYETKSGNLTWLRQRLDEALGE